MRTEDRIRTMVRHWVNHLQDHIDEFERWQRAAGPHVAPEVVSSLDEARKYMAAARTAMLRAAYGLGEIDGRKGDERDS